MKTTQYRVVRVQGAFPSSFGGENVIFRVGTTVEIACLYTICNTEFLWPDPLRRITY